MSQTMTVSSFQFINLSTPATAQDPSTRRAIHQHAMRDIGLTRRRPRKKRGVTDIPLDLSLLHSINNPNLRSTPLLKYNTSPNTQLSSSSSSPLPLSYPIPPLPSSPYALLGPGTIDPFLPYPIPLTPSVRFLVAHIFHPSSPTSSSLRALRDDWFPVSLSSPVTFHLVLSSSALGLAYLRSKGRNPTWCTHTGDAQSLKHLGIAISSFKNDLASEEFRRSDEAVGAVVGFLCHDGANGNLESWLQHREGLRGILDFRGGVDAVNGNKTLRTTISWVELRGAFIWDLHPYIPLPSSWENYATPPTHASASSMVLPEWLHRFGLASPFLRLFADLLDFSAATATASAQRGVGFWTKDLEGGGWPNVLVHRLLSWRPLEDKADLNTVRRYVGECCRLACLLYLAPVWRKFGVQPLLTGGLVEKLARQLRKVPGDWGILWESRMWVLVVAGMEAGDTEGGSSADSASLREIGAMLVVLMREKGLMDWKGLLGVVKSVAWIGDVFDGRDEVLGNEVRKNIEENSRGI